MNLQMATVGHGLLDRGLYKLPAMGPDGECYIFAVTSDKRLTPMGIVMLPWGSNLDLTVEALAVELDQIDPVTERTRRIALQVS